MKSFKKKARKGFTLIELVVVIAVIAILGGVSVATYVVVMKNANLSNDQQTIKMMNDTLTQHQYSDGGKNSKVSDAVSDLYADGFDLSSKHAYSSGYHYVYNQSQDQMVLVDGSWSAVYPEKSSIGSDTWAFYKGSGEDISASVNNYFVFNDVSETNLTMFPGAAVIDLNGYMCTAENNYSGNIKIQNGFCYEALNGHATNCTLITSENVGTVEKKAYKFGVEPDIGALPSTIVVEGLYVNGVDNKTAPKGMVNQYLEKKYTNASATEFAACNLIIKNCSFMNSQSDGILSSTTNANRFKTVTFDSCSFTSQAGWTVQTEDATDFTFTNNKLIDCERGFNLVGNYKNITISNNTVKLFNAAKSNFIQFGGAKVADYESITVSNNKVENANAALVLHDSMAGIKYGSVGGDSLAKIKKNVNLDLIKSKFKFNNNSYVNLSASTLAIADPDLATEYDNSKTTDAAVVAYFNELANGMSAYIK